MLRVSSTPKFPKHCRSVHRSVAFSLVCAKSQQLLDQFCSSFTNRPSNYAVIYFCLFIVATGCPSERRPQKTVSCYGEWCKDTGGNYWKLSVVV